MVLTPFLILVVIMCYRLLSDDFGSSKGEQNVEMLGEFRMRLSEFMTFCARTFVSIFQLYGRNVARQRDLLVTCFEELHALQTEVGTTILLLSILNIGVSFISFKRLVGDVCSLVDIVLTDN